MYCGSKGVSVQFVTYLSVVSQCGCVRHICGLWVSRAWQEWGMCVPSLYLQQVTAPLGQLLVLPLEHELEHKLAMAMKLFSDKRQFKILVRIGAKLMEEA